MNIVRKFDLTRVVDTASPFVEENVEAFFLPTGIPLGAIRTVSFGRSVLSRMEAHIKDIQKIIVAYSRNALEQPLLRGGPSQEANSVEPTDGSIAHVVPGGIDRFVSYFEMQLFFQFFRHLDGARTLRCEYEELSRRCCSVNRRSKVDEPPGNFGDVFRMLEWYEVISQVEDVGQDDEFADVDEWVAGEDFPHGHIVAVLGLFVIIYGGGRLIAGLGLSFFLFVPS